MYIVYIPLSFFLLALNIISRVRVDPPRSGDSHHDGWSRRPLCFRRPFSGCCFFNPYYFWGKSPSKNLMRHTRCDATWNSCAFADTLDATQQFSLHDGRCERQHWDSNCVWTPRTAAVEKPKLELKWMTGTADSSSLSTQTNKWQSFMTFKISG